jgi:hypothetical protein
MEEHTKTPVGTHEALTNGAMLPVFTPRTALAKRLWELRQEILASGVPLLSLDEIRQEVQARRGGVATTEFITVEKSTKPLFRVTGLAVQTLLAS